MSKTPRANRGAVGEHQAILYYLEQGYQVFRNVSAHGPADLVAWDPDTNETLFIDVKSVTEPYIRADGEYSVSIVPKNKRHPLVKYFYIYGGKLLGILP